MRAKLIAEGVLGSNAYVVIAGPANTYAHYVTTPEEYAMQRYEGASTIFGQWTLDSYIVRASCFAFCARLEPGVLTRGVHGQNKYSSLVGFLKDGNTSQPASDPAPPDLSGSALSLRVC